MLFGKMAAELLERVEDDARRHSRWPGTLTLTLQLLPSAAAAGDANAASAARTTARSMPFPAAPASVDRLVRWHGACTHDSG